MELPSYLTDYRVPGQDLTISRDMLLDPGSWPLIIKWLRKKGAMDAWPAVKIEIKRRIFERDRVMRGIMATYRASEDLDLAIDAALNPANQN